MIKQIFSKFPRKYSKSSGDRSKKSSCDIDEAISSPYSVLNIGDNLENISRQDKNSRSNENLVPDSYEALPSFKDVPSTHKQQLFMTKIEICCVMFDFTDSTKHVKEKEIKRQTLLELAEYVDSAANGKFGETVIQKVIRMISVNIFRDFTPQPRVNTLPDGLDLEEDELVMDLAWPHLQAVYEFFLRFITCQETDAKIAKRYMDHSFILKLLHLFDSEFPSEREYLKTILHRIYGKFMVHRPFIRKAINNTFYYFIFEMERHNGIAEFLEVLGSIINGFTLPLKEEHKLFLVRTLIPMHKPKCLAMYHQQLAYCITQFVEKDYKLADVVIRGLIKYWPVSNSSKEVLFLNELEEVLEATRAPEFQRCMAPLFRRISWCLSSLHFQRVGCSTLQPGSSKVAERALLLWNNDHIDNLIKQNRKVILSIIFPALERNARQHWNQAVHSLTMNVRKIFYDLDPDLFEACQIKFQADECKENEIKEKREATWKLLEDASAKTAASNEAILVS
ncbi:hypothetical protein OROHE_022855 [Orobanche hederae]